MVWQGSIANPYRFLSYPLTFDTLVRPQASLCTEGSFSYPRVSTRGVRHSPADNKKKMKKKKKKRHIWRFLWLPNVGPNMMPTHSTVFIVTSRTQKKSMQMFSKSINVYCTWDWTYGIDLEMLNVNGLNSEPHPASTRHQRDKACNATCESHAKLGGIHRFHM